MDGNYAPPIVARCAHSTTIGSTPLPQLSWALCVTRELSMEIPFDNNSGEKYAFDISIEDIDSGDGIVLNLNRAACLSFAKLFTDLAGAQSNTHIHLGYDESEPQGPGIRVVLNEAT